MTVKKVESLNGKDSTTIKITDDQTIANEINNYFPNALALIKTLDSKTSIGYDNILPKVLIQMAGMLHSVLRLIINKS